MFFGTYVSTFGLTKLFIFFLFLAAVNGAVVEIDAVVHAVARVDLTTAKRGDTATAAIT
jgi:type IV secretory pathway VirB3-like protein